MIKLSHQLIEKKKKQFNLRKKHSILNYEKLLEPYLDSHQNLCYVDYVQIPDLGDRKVLLIRHDVDHDYLTAQKIAKWEYTKSLRSTYCLLHTAWYYGELKGDRIVHTQELADCAKYLYDLGHEINFHNNLVVTALKEKINPEKLLIQELEFFDSLGIPVVGTSTHGDSLCRELNFRNWELFKECCDDRFGGPRTVNYESVEVDLGSVSMAEFNLKYEAYDILRDLYHTDSGGNLRTRHKARGRKSFGRKDLDKGEVIGVLTHPIWWNFDEVDKL